MRNGEKVSMTSSAPPSKMAVLLPAFSHARRVRLTCHHPFLSAGFTADTAQKSICNVQSEVQESTDHMRDSSEFEGREQTAIACQSRTKLQQYTACSSPQHPTLLKQLSSDLP